MVTKDQPGCTNRSTRNLTREGNSLEGYTKRSTRNLTREGVDRRNAIHSEAPVA